LEKRRRLCALVWAGLGFLGRKLDEARNVAAAETSSTNFIRVTIRIIRTDERLMIARSVGRVLVLGKRVEMGMVCGNRPWGEHPMLPPRRSAHDNMVSPTVESEGDRGTNANGGIPDFKPSHTMRMQQAIRTSETRYRRLFETAQDGILILAEDTGQIVDVNPFLIRLLGYSHAELLGKKLWEAGSFRDIADCRMSFERLQKDGYMRYEDLPLETKDGRRINVEFVSNVYRVDGQKVIQCNIGDITERKRAEHDMIASEKRYRRLFETAKDGILILNADTGRIVDVNPFLHELLGYPRAYFISKKLWELEFFKDIVANEAKFAELRKTEYIHYEDLPMKTADGRRIDVEFISNVYSVNGHLVIQCNIRDITARKQAEEMQRESDEMNRGVLNSVLAHIAVLDRDGKIIAVNDAWRQYARDNCGNDQALLARTDVGANYLEVCGKSRGKFSAEAESAHDGLQAVLRGEKDDFTLEYPCHSPKEQRWFILSVTPLKQNNGGVVVSHNNITEQKKTEEKRQKASAELRLMFQHMLNAFIVCESVFDEHGKYVSFRFGYFNDAYRKITGVTPEEVKGKDVFEVWPFTEQSWVEVYGEVAVTGVPKTFDMYHAPTEGWYHCNAYRPTDSSAQVCVIFEDITARRQTELELQQRTALLLAQLESSIDGILVVDNAGEKILQNMRMADLWKIPPEVAASKDDAKQIQFLMSRTENPVQFLEKVTYLNAHPDEVSRDEIELLDGMIFDRYSAPVRDQTGKQYGRIWTFRDITKNRQAEAALQFSEAQLRATFECAAIGIALANSDSRLVKCNPALVKMLGYSETELGGMALSEITHPEDWETEIGLFRSLLAGERGSYDIEKRFLRQNGKVVWGHLTVSLVRQAAAETPLAIGLIEDITEKRKLAEHLRHSQKMEGIGQLAGGVAHDFNNILAVIQMQSELMNSSGGLSAEQKEFADEIGTTVKRGAALTRQLLLFSRREVFQPRHLDLSESITSTATMLSRILGENIAMQLKLAALPMFIQADAGMIDQVLMNLAVNARDAMPNGGQLIIETSGVEFDEFAAAQSPQMQVGSFVRLSVSDTGCGIPPENLQKVFEPFFTTKNVGKGTGLGLATVFGIVQQHQGWINVYSEVNHGTTFRVYLPRLATNGEPIALPPAMGEMRGGNETILLAEDDPALRVSVRKALSQLGYRILETPTGVKALEVWKQNRDEVRLLLTDLVMPDGMSGKGLAERLLQENPRLKVIYMSGYSAEVAGQDFPLEEGANFLTKPFQAAKLAQTVRAALDAQNAAPRRLKRAEFR